MDVLLGNKMFLPALMICVGLIMVFYDFLRAYKVWRSYKWTKGVATVSNNVPVGIFYKLITFGYSAFDVYAKQYKTSQLVPSNSWANGLYAGTQISVYYNKDNPEQVLIGRPPLWTCLLFGSLNCLWIICGLLLLLLNMHHK